MGTTVEQGQQIMCISGFVQDDHRKLLNKSCDSYCWRQQPYICKSKTHAINKRTLMDHSDVTDVCNAISGNNTIVLCTIY